MRLAKQTSLQSYMSRLFRFTRSLWLLCWLMLLLLRSGCAMLSAELTVLLLMSVGRDDSICLSLVAGAALVDLRRLAELAADIQSWPGLVLNLNE